MFDEVTRVSNSPFVVQNLVQYVNKLVRRSAGSYPPPRRRIQRANPSAHRGVMEIPGPIVIENIIGGPKGTILPE
jgi:hypothetical protein